MTAKINLDATAHLGALGGSLLLARLNVLQERSYLFTELRTIRMSVGRNRMLRSRLEQFLFAAFDSKCATLFAWV